MESINNIIMIGMPASGKSTVGVILAKTLGKSFLDVDLLIQERQKDLLQNLIDKFGMDRFLQMEEEALLSISEANTVISTGGSAVYSEKGMQHMSKLGEIVYLKLSIESIENRLYNINTRGIAMAPGQTLKDLYMRRVPLYERYADITIEADGMTVEEVVESIISGIKR